METIHSSYWFRSYQVRFYTLVLIAAISVPFGMVMIQGNLNVGETLEVFKTMNILGQVIFLGSMMCNISIATVIGEMLNERIAANKVSFATLNLIVLAGLLVAYGHIASWLIAPMMTDYWPIVLLGLLLLGGSPVVAGVIVWVLIRENASFTEEKHKN